MFPDVLEALLVKRAFGEAVADKASRSGFSGKDLKNTVAAMLDLSDRFNGISAKPLGDYMQSRYLRTAYLVYFLPANFVKIQAVMPGVARTPAGGRPFRVLDAGAGPGSMSLGVLDYLARKHLARRVEITAADSSREALADWRFLVDAYAAALGEEGIGLSLTPRPQVVDISTPPPTRETYDLVIFGDVLNELYCGEDAVRKRANLVAKYADLLTDNGCLIIIEPALKAVARALQKVRDRLVGEYGLHVWAPCLDESPCPMLLDGRARDWCHSGALWIRPKTIRKIDELARRRKLFVKFSYIVVGKAAGKPVEAPAGKTVFRVVGDLLREKGKVRALLCGGPGCRMATLLARDIAPETEDFVELRRGDIVAVGSWEDKLDGWRLSRDSGIELVKRFSEIGGSK